MKCMKSELLAILPPKYRNGITEELLPDLQEIRLRLGQPALLVCTMGNRRMEPAVGSDDIRFCVNTASRYSPWNAATVKEGFLTAPGGHRIGLCGEAAGETIRNLTSLCIRVAKDLPELGAGVGLRESTLIIGPPGSGKTTLLRALIRRLSTVSREQIAVVDERCEIFPIANGMSCFDPGPATDVLSAREKDVGIEMVLRAMGPTWIAVDEITAERDCDAMLRAGWCGVKLLATAHASDCKDLYSRKLYQRLIADGLFRNVIVMHSDKTFHQERI